MRILTIDIETLPLTVYSWGLWDQNIPINMIKEPGSVICFAAKWYGEKKVMFFKSEDVVQAAWELLDQADAVIHFNGKKFDVPHLNTEFFLAGYGPPSPFKQIDLCNVVKRRFKFPSNKLQYVSKAIELPGKVDTGGFALWTGVMRDDIKAWKQMERYNKQDVVLTEQLYIALRPWIPQHPNTALYDLKMDGCPTCGSHRTQKRGFYYTAVSRYQQYMCNDCGKYFRDTSRIEGVYVTESVL